MRRRASSRVRNVVRNDSRPLYSDLLTPPRNAGGPSSYALERLVGIKHHRVRAIQLKLANSPFAAYWKTELVKAGITAETL